MTLYVFTNGLVMHNTIYNEDFLKSTVMSDEIRTAVVEEVSLEIKEYMISQSSIDPSQLSAADIDEFYDVETGNEFADQMVDYTMDELIDLFLEGDTKIDEDRFDEIFDEYGEDFFDEVEEDKDPFFTESKPVQSPMPETVGESFEMPANIAVLKKLISQLPNGVSRHTGAQIIKQTMEALGISMRSVLQDAQQVQESLKVSARECQASIQDYKKQILSLEKQSQNYQIGRAHV